MFSAFMQIKAAFFEKKIAIGCIFKIIPYICFENVNFLRLPSGLNYFAANCYMKKIRLHNWIAALFFVAFTASPLDYSYSISQYAFTKSNFSKIIISGYISIDRAFLNPWNIYNADLIPDNYLFTTPQLPKRSL